MKMYIANGGYFPTQGDAKAAAKVSGGDWALEEVPTDLRGLVAYLNALIGRSRASASVVAASGAEEAPVAPEAANGIDPAFDLEAAFEAAPLGLQLSLASIATENAYQHLKRTSPIPLAPQGYGGSVERKAEAADDLL